jgi:Fe-S cluster assembly ATPase SufC
MARRAEFSAATKKIIAERAGYQCSVLSCGQLTSGPGPGQMQVLKIGMAAHIYAASAGGPRGTGGLSADERGQPENGIWCCYSHGKAIDSDAGNAFSVAELHAWKRLHEARKSAEMSGAAHDRFGLVESISVNSAPILTGRRFELGMRNIITGPNASGKSILARLIASVAYPDYVAKLSQQRNVDIEVSWFDPYAHNVNTSGRSGNVTHVLDGQPVPYVARPYKTILLDDPSEHYSLASVIALSQLFDLSLSAMNGMLTMLVESSKLVKEIHIHGTSIDWVVDVNGRTIRSPGVEGLSGGQQSRILFELAGIHACHHARVEPTFLIVDSLLDCCHPQLQADLIERLGKVAEHAQVAVITHSQKVIEEMSPGWVPTTLDYRRAGERIVPRCPIDFEIETSAARPALTGNGPTDV